MSKPMESISQRTERVAFLVSGLAAAVGLILAAFDRADVAVAYRFSLIACLAPSVGCMIFMLIHRTTGGQWALSLRPYLRSGAALMPWIWLLAFPLLALPHFLGGGHPARPASGYESVPMVSIRAGLFAALFFGLSWAVGLETGSDQNPRSNRHPWVGPVGLIVLVFTLTLLADDWIEALEPGWHSTAFPVVWMVGQAVSGLGLAVLAAMASGARPAATGPAGRTLGNDWGNLLLATVFFWTYVAFGQFLIVWSGNKLDEIAWYLRREQGLWFWVPPVLALGNFLTPFLLLLSRNFKEKAAGLGSVAAALFLGQVAYDGWLVLPSAYPLTIVGTALATAFLAAGGGFFINRFCRSARLFGASDR